MARVMLNVALVLISTYFQEAASGEVCYGDLGCFSNMGAFFSFLHRPISFLPESPEKIATEFLLFTRKNPDNMINVTLNEDFSTVTNFDPRRETRIIVHGFLDNAFLAKWMFGLKDELLKAGDVNVFVVDWSKGNGFPYTQATANCRVVGAQIAKLILRLKMDPSKIHIIGHSLGAHIAGYAGDRIKGLARISGLDPAGPFFSYMPEEVRLDAGDALLVDAIHTDTGMVTGYGSKQPMGHMDFYPNGGLFMPGCTASPFSALFDGGFSESVRETFACNHLRSIQLYKESINDDSCIPRGHKCSSWENFSTGKCTDCSEDGDTCAKMGFHADQHKRPAGSKPEVFYLITYSKAPFCVHQYRVVLQLGKDFKSASGRITLKINGQELTTSTELKVNPGEELVFVAGSEEVLTNLNSAETVVKVIWEESKGFSFYSADSEIQVEAITISPMPKGGSSKFCGSINTDFKKC